MWILCTGSRVECGLLWSAAIEAQGLCDRQPNWEEYQVPFRDPRA